MGRIKTKQVKRITGELMQSYTDEFTTEFEANKKIVNKYVDARSKKLVNMIAGFVTRKKKKIAG